ADAERLALGAGGAHRRGAVLELAADPVRLDRLLVAVPADALDAHLGHVPAEAAVAIEEGHLCAGAGRRERRRQPARAAADDEDVRLVHDLRRAGRLADRGHAAGVSATANTGFGLIAMRTAVPGASSEASAADVWAQFRPSSGS